MLSAKTFKKLLWDAFPIISSSFGLLLMGVTDTVIIARLGEEALAAQSLGAFIHMAVFMTLVAFVFPVSNVYALNPKQGMPVLKAGLTISVLLALFLTLVYFWGIPSWVPRLLTFEQTQLFNAYFKTIAFCLVPGALFFFCRMLLYTEERPKQIGHWVAVCIFINLGLDLWAFHAFSNPVETIRIIAFVTVLIFILLVLLSNLTLPKPKRLFNILQIKSNLKAYISVAKTCVPASSVALGEYGFFATLAVMVALYLPEQAAAYRVFLQVEEMLIIVFYALARVLSLEVSARSHESLELTKPSYIHAVIVLLLVLFILPILHPYALKAYNIQIEFSSHYFTIITLLLLSEAGMLYICSFLWGFARYNAVAVITCLVNWGLVLPTLWLWSPTQIEIFYYALIINYALVSVFLLLLAPGKKIGSRGDIYK